MIIIDNGSTDNTSKVTRATGAEVVMIITTRGELVIMTGCAHPGIADIIRRVKDIAPDDRICLVVI